jgi:hypothetical protein
MNIILPILKNNGNHFQHYYKYKHTSGFLRVMVGNGALTKTTYVFDETVLNTDIHT